MRYVMTKHYDGSWYCEDGDPVLLLETDGRVYFHNDTFDAIKTRALVATSIHPAVQKARIEAAKQRPVDLVSGSGLALDCKSTGRRTHGPSRFRRHAI